MDVQRMNALLTADWPGAEPAANPVAPQEGPKFGDVLAQAMDKVEQAQSTADQAVVQLATGQVKDVAEVMIASERANLTLSLALQVRNKLLEAYQEIMRMPL